MLLGKQKDNTNLLNGFQGGRGAVAGDAATIMCGLSDLYTRNGLDGKWRELVNVYEQRKNDDNLREILDLSAPTKRMNDLHGWHLERMAVGELGGAMETATGDVAVIKSESHRTKQVLQRILANGKQFRAKREQVVTAMVQQRDVLLAELEAAKVFLEQIHAAEQHADAAEQLTAPAPVEKRLLATVKPLEASETVNLSEAPPI